MCYEPYKLYTLGDTTHTHAKFKKYPIYTRDKIDVPTLICCFFFFISDNIKINIIYSLTHRGRVKRRLLGAQTGEVHALGRSRGGSGRIRRAVHGERGRRQAS